LHIAKEVQDKFKAHLEIICEKGKLKIADEDAEYAPKIERASFIIKNAYFNKC
jgi:hypothetical protein